MLRYFLYLSLLLIFPLAAALILVRALPEPSSSELEKLLVSSHCSTPCFMGLRPGETSSYEAGRLLGEHAWVERVDSRLVGGQGGYIYWYWNANAPHWVDSSSRGVIWVARGRVDQMWVGTNIPLGELLLQLGEPDIKIVDENIDYGHGLYQYRGVYGSAGLVVVSWQQCKVADPYHTNTILKFREVMDRDALQSMEYLDKWRYTFNNCKNVS